MVTWEYNSTSHQPSSFDVRCNGRRHYNIISVSNGTFRVNVGDLLPNASYDCCVSAKYTRPGGSIITTEIRCASIRSEDLLTLMDIAHHQWHICKRDDHCSGCRARLHPHCYPSY